MIAGASEVTLKDVGKLYTQQLSNKTKTKNKAWTMCLFLGMYRTISDAGHFGGYDRDDFVIAVNQIWN